MKTPLLKPKPEKRDIIAVSVPKTIKATYQEASKLADQIGFDLPGSLSDKVADHILRLKEELGRHAKQRAAINGELVSKM